MRMVVPVDGSEPAQKAVEYTLTHYPDTTVTALHVIAPPETLYAGDVDFNYTRLMDEKHEELLAEVEKLVTPEGASIRMETTVGRPNRVIELARLTVYNWRKPTEWKSVVIRGPTRPIEDGDLAQAATLFSNVGEEAALEVFNGPLSEYETAWYELEITEITGRGWFPGMRDRAD